MKHKEKPKGQEEPKAESGELQELRKQLENLQKEKDEIFGQLQRVSADYINYQKRVSKQTADTVAYEKEKIIKTLLPALDNFEHMLQNAASVKDADVVLKGVRIIYDQILDILKSLGVERIDALGAKFDPALHEAVSHKAEPKKQENIVLEEFQKGYKINGRVLRPSRVIINKLPSTEQPAEQQSADDETVDLNAETIDLEEDETTDTSDETRETSDE